MSFFFQELVNGITTGALYALVALGFSMVYGVLKLLNFAHGDLYMIGAYIGFFVIQWFGGSTALTIPVPLLLVIMFVLAGGLVGGLLIGVAESFITGYISSTYTNLLVFALLIVVLLVRPSGLFGRAQLQKV